MTYPAFVQQLEVIRLRAMLEGKVITKLDWRHGHLSAELAKPPRAPPPQDALL